jgi:hypothetical protein
VFHPEYLSNGLFYVNYTDLEGDTHVLELRDFGAEAGPDEVRELLDVPQPYSNHNGGQLAFGPDGLLYVGMGDGGSGGDPENRAQDLSSRLGKMLRIDVDQPGAEWEKFAYGLRNPWRFSFDRVTGDLWIGDVGQLKQEEIDRVSAPDLSKEFNFGWDVYEGSDIHEDKPLTPGGILVEPLTEYSHDLGCSVTGGYVYRGAIPGLQGRYFFADFCTGEIWSFNPTLGAVDLIEHTAALQPAAGSIGNVGGFGEDGFGELYIVDRAPSGNGEVYKIVTPVSGYLLDGFGGLHPLGGAPAVSPSPPYFGFDAAEDVELSGGGGYVLDAFGGVHARGAPVLSPATPYFGFDVARDVELAGSGYYVLDAFGGVHRGGGAPAITAPTPYFGFNVARDLEVASTGYYVLDGFGGVHRGNGAAVLPPATPYFGFDTARDLELAGTGYYVLDGFGRVHAGGGASPILVPTPLFSFDIARDLELTAPGFYVLDGFGGIHAGGGAVPFAPPAPFFGFDIARDLELR